MGNVGVVGTLYLWQVLILSHLLADFSYYIFKSLLTFPSPLLLSLISQFHSVEFLFSPASLQPVDCLFESSLHIYFAHF